MKTIESEDAKALSEALANQLSERLFWEERPNVFIEEICPLRRASADELKRESSRPEHGGFNSLC